MSVSDPWIKELKGYTLQLLQLQDLSNGDSSILENNNGAVHEKSPGLLEFCACVERILQQGVVARRFYFRYVTEAWLWMEEFGDKESVGYNYHCAVQQVKKCPRDLTMRGRLRLLIRYCLVKRCLHTPLEMLVEHGSGFYTCQSILGDEIKLEILHSVALQIARIPFHLNLINSAFLNTCWQRPVLAQHELVPFKSTEHGLSFQFCGDYAVINEIIRGSVFAEIEDICLGDILNSVDGALITAKSMVPLFAILVGSREPVIITVVKARLSGGCQFYQPLAQLIGGTDLADKMNQATSTDNKIKKSKKMKQATSTDNNIMKSKKPIAPNNTPGASVVYLGKVSTLRDGSVGCIAAAMDKLHRNRSQLKQRAAVIECQEIGVKVTDSQTHEVMLKHSYMEISSCGQSAQHPTYFAYIAGEDGKSCNIASQFTCHVFTCNDKAQTEEILMGIGQGFRRTHFAV